MNTKKIVFATDFSHGSDAALEYATALARQLRATLFIVHAEEPPVAYGRGPMYHGILEPDLVELRLLLAEIMPTDPHVPCEHRLLCGHGNSATKLVQFARDIEADLIVMGTHGRTGFKRLLMGSVADSVVRRANCPVLVMRQGCERPAPVAN